MSGPTPQTSQTKSSGSSGVSTVTSQPQTVQRNVYFFSFEGLRSP